MDGEPAPFDRAKTRILVTASTSVATSAAYAPNHRRASRPSL